jgi:hypothetical protein
MIDLTLWQHCIEALVQRLDSEDDPRLWQDALDVIFCDLSQQARDYTGKDAIIAEIGPCSHWIRPHWTSVSDGTRFPSGYNQTVTGFSFRSLPQFDWSLRWKYDPEAQAWVDVKGQPSRRPLTYRIVIPARSTRHSQATVSTIWQPGSPADPANKLLVVYGFERNNNTWQRFARTEHEHKS